MAAVVSEQRRGDGLETQAQPLRDLPGGTGVAEERCSCVYRVAALCCGPRARGGLRDAERRGYDSHRLSEGQTGRLGRGGDADSAGARVCHGRTATRRNAPLTALPPPRLAAQPRGVSYGW